MAQAVTLTPEAIDRINEARSVATAEELAATTAKRDAASAALETSVQAERRHLADPLRDDLATAADQARDAYTTARATYRAAVTKARTAIDQRVQAAIDAK